MINFSSVLSGTVSWRVAGVWAFFPVTLGKELLECDCGDGSGGGEGEEEGCVANTKSVVGGVFGSLPKFRNPLLVVE